MDDQVIEKITIAIKTYVIAINVPLEVDIVSGSTAVKVDPIANLVPGFTSSNNGRFFRPLHRVT